MTSDYWKMIQEAQRQEQIRRQEQQQQQAEAERKRQEAEKARQAEVQRQRDEQEREKIRKMGEEAVRAGEAANRASDRPVNVYSDTSVPDRPTPANVSQRGYEATPLATGNRLTTNIPSGAKIAERDAQGKITVYEKDGIRYYTPDNVMWKMGYRTNREYHAEGGAGRTEKPDLAASPYVPIVTGKGVMHITRSEYNKLIKIKDEDERKAQLKNLLGIKEDVPVLARDDRLSDLSRGGMLDLSRAVEAGITDPTDFDAAGFTLNLRDISVQAQKVAERRGQAEKYEEVMQVLKPYADKDGNIDLVKAGRAINNGNDAVERALFFMNISGKDVKAGRDIAREVKVDTSAIAANKATLDFVSTKLPDGNYILKTELERIKAENPNQYKILTVQGFEAYQSAMNNAVKTLEKYRNKDGTYNVLDAMQDAQVTLNTYYNNQSKVRDVDENDRNRAWEVSDSIKLLFSKDTLTDIYEKNSASLTTAKTKAPNLWKESFIGALAITGGAQSAAQGTPFPHDDVIVKVATFLLAGGLIGKAVYERIKSRQATEKDIQDIPDTVKIAVPTETGYRITPAAQVLDELFRKPYTSPGQPMPPGKTLTSPGELLKPAPIPPSPGKFMDTPEPYTSPGEISKPQQLPGTTLLRPGRGWYVLSATSSSVLVDAADSERKAAEDALDAFEKVLADYPAKGDSRGRGITGDIESEYSNRSSQEALKKLKEYRASAGASASPRSAYELFDESRALSLDDVEMAGAQRAYLAWLNKRAMLLAAWTSYVASVNPTPVSGQKVDDKTKAAIAEELLRAVGTETKNAAKVRTAIENLKATLSNAQIQTMIALYTKTLNQSVAKGATRTVAQSQAKQAVEQAVKALTLTSTATSASKTDTATRAVPRTATRTAEKVNVKTARATARLKGKPFGWPDGGASDDKKREYIKSYKGGKTAINMGKLHGKDVWHVKMDNGERIVVIGKKPEGVTFTADGPGSASRTTQRVGKKRNFPEFDIQFGAIRGSFKPTGAPKGADVRFKPTAPKPTKTKNTGTDSVKRGRIYVTKVGKGRVGYSRNPIPRRKYGR